MCPRDGKPEPPPRKILRMVDGPPEVKAEEALAVARLWDAGSTGVAHLRSGENSNWRVESDDGGGVLRLTSEAHRTRAQLEAELDFVEHVAGGGMEAARPRRSPAGDRVLDVSDLLSGAGRIHATLFEHLPGRHFEYHSADVGEPLLRRWGREMARLHELSRGFAARPGWRRPEWFDDRVAGCPVGPAALDGETLALRQDLVGWLRGPDPDPLHYGMVHGDFERTNFLLRDDGRLALLDFDDCCRHWFVWEIACALWAFRNAPPEDRARFLEWCLAGYATLRPLDRERLARFSDLIRLRTIALLLRRLRDPDRAAGASEGAWIERTRLWLRSSWSW